MPREQSGDEGPRTNGEPDWFFLISGGKDSVVAAHVALPALQENYQKTPVVVYLDTTVGLDAQRLYVERLCDEFGLQLWTLRTHENFEDIAQEDGLPGPARHTRIQNALKGRQRQKLSTVSGDAHFITGIRREESPARESTPRAHYDKGTRAWYYSPILNWTEADLEEYIAEHDIPRNPLWDEPHPTDCWCGAHGSPEELIEGEANGFEWFTKRIREIEESVDKMDRTATWGWGGLNPKERRAEDAKNDDDQLSLCGPSCAAYEQARPDGGEPRGE